MTCFETSFAVLLNIETWKNWVPIISLFVAIGALSIAFWQVKVGRNTSASAQAHGIYQQYLALCIAHPKLASGDYVAKGENDPEYAKYTWFFSSMLFAFEQLLEAKPNDDKWIATIKSQLEKHKNHLVKSSTAASNQWHEDLEAIIKTVKGAGV
ncbi:hypothetical protein PULV_a1656 [Pseudoalteromonas ulvae UL12]|uniref:hypothetical protein n=1 Tax=Pseudoalteromonas ulvae TaxID=107327 RepID=UPI00186B8059|nr:hypothetical protein [Pseudoalteromonas ulvae]MBE0364100.1 hypothetical protein [Pseudoalteromonas ulvae UL12]